MPQTALLRLEADRGFETISDTVGVENLLAEWIWVKLISLEELSKG